MCIVVVDDEPELLDLVSRVLEEEGYKVLAFGHPRPVTELKDSEEPLRLFLIDIMLPEMDGITLAARLKNEGFTTIPKIAMSASQEWLQESKKSKLFDATLDKPFDIDELLDCVERHIS